MRAVLPGYVFTCTCARARVNDRPPVQVKEAFNAIDMCEEAIVKKAFTRANDCLKRAIELFKHTHSETVAKIRTNLNQVRNLMKYLSRMDSIRFSVTYSQTILKYAFGNIAGGNERPH